MPVSASQARAWMEQWRSAASALDAQRRDELARLAPEKALAASEALLSVADPRQLTSARRASSGLLEQQAILHRR